MSPIAAPTASPAHPPCWVGFSILSICLGVLHRVVFACVKEHRVVAHLCFPLSLSLRLITYFSVKCRGLQERSVLWDTDPFPPL